MALLVVGLTGCDDTPYDNYGTGYGYNPHQTAVVLHETAPVVHYSDPTVVRKTVIVNKPATVVKKVYVNKPVTVI